jgi:hypothetical protein
MQYIIVSKFTDLHKTFGPGRVENVAIVSSTETSLLIVLVLFDEKMAAWPIETFEFCHIIMWSMNTDDNGMNLHYREKTKFCQRRM